VTEFPDTTAGAWILLIVSVVAAFAGVVVVRLMLTQNRSRIDVSRVEVVDMYASEPPHFRIHAVLRVVPRLPTFHIIQATTKLSYGRVALTGNPMNANSVTDTVHSSGLNSPIQWRVIGLESLLSKPNASVEIEIKTEDGGHFKRRFPNLPIANRELKP
jgi:hypothetical protein